MVFPITRVVYTVLLVMLVCWLVFDTAKNGTRQLVSFAGLVLLILLMALFSKSLTRVTHTHTHSVWVKYYFNNADLYAGACVYSVISDSDHSLLKVINSVTSDYVENAKMIVVLHM